MNTSYHKSRIVDNGWKSVILNCVAAPFYFVFPQRRTPNSKRPRISILPSLTTEKNTNTKDSQVIKQVHGNKQSNISIISKLAVDIDSTANISDHCQQKHGPAQSTSKANNTIPGTENAILLVRNISLDSESEVGDKVPRKSYRLRMGEEILRNMLTNINNEDGYMHYFRQLIEFENSVKCRESGNLDGFQIVPFSSSNCTKQCKIKFSGICLTDDTTSGRRKPTEISRSKNKPLEEIALKVNFTVALVLDRIQLRQDILKHFQTYCDDEESYESFINIIFDFEESLIDD